MSSHTAQYLVSATYKGERVHLATRNYPRQQLLSLSLEPVLHAEEEAQRIAALAEQDDTLSAIRVEVGQ